jgi:hypothetical protein
MAESDDDKGVHFAAQHDTEPRRALKIATTDGSSKFNTIRIPLIPVACWTLKDPAFAFDSSFVSPSFQAELGVLSGIVGANQECPAALFGHCDPAGKDDLNKTLGDRRAIAIYALLTRQPDLWAYLYDTKQVGDTWDLHMVQTMLASVQDGQGGPYYAGDIDGARTADTIDAVKRFQADAGLAADGDPGHQTRKALFGAYMDWLCTPAPAAAPFRMQASDFLGGTGAAPGDLPKMSLQSCGKYNPIVLLTKDEMAGEDTTDGASKVQRNADDAPNRRVIMFLFEKGTTVEPSHWPCPKVKEANTACKDAFWSDGDARRQNGDTQRLYEKTRDTMACRFYDRFARRSPCESPDEDAYLVRLHDDEVKPIAPPVPYRVTMGSTPGVRASSTDGWVKIPLPKDKCLDTVRIEWGTSGSTSDRLPFFLDLMVDCDVGEERAQTRAKLNNIGYSVSTDEQLGGAVTQFQADYGLSEHGCNPDGSLPAKTRARLWAIYDRKCDATRKASSKAAGSTGASQDP